MISNLLTKLWPAQPDSNSQSIRKSSITLIAIEKLCSGITSSSSNSNSNNSSGINPDIIKNTVITDASNNKLLGFTEGSVIVTTTRGLAEACDMERQRSTKRSSFRMRISRRIRSGFMPVPQYDSDSDFATDGACTLALETEGSARRNEASTAVPKGEASRREAEKKTRHANEADRKLQADGKTIEQMGGGGRRGGVDGGEGGRREGGGEGMKDKLTVMPDLRHLGGSVRGTRREKENYDLTVDAECQLGYNYIQRRRSFGSESEKRRGERFQRREIERRGTVEESDDDDDDVGDSSGSSESHICDTTCPLIIQGKCPALQRKLRNLSAQRRSSFTSSSSRESALATVTSSRRPPRPLASLSIDDIPGGFSAHEYGMGLPKSPGLLSTVSMWSTSDLHHASGKPEDAGSHGGTNSLSLSNVSGSFSERMHELVRAFSSRTQRAKEKISQPPTPSSESDYDAKSAVSGQEEPQAPRNIRLGSFLPMGSRASDAFSDENHDHFVGVWHCKFKTPKFLKRFKFPSTMEPHSKMYVTWLFLVSLAFMYNVIVIPLRGVFPYQTPENVQYWLIADYLCDFIYILDIVVFKSRLRFANNGVIECDRKETRKHYMKKWMFRFDVASLTPLDLLYLIEGVGVNPWLRLPRILKIQSYWEFYEKCDQASRSSAHAIRIVKTMTYMLFLIHVETCGYYAVSVYEGLGSNEWVYSGNGIAYIRCFYLATKTATSIGNNPTPTTTLEVGFMTLYWLSGVFVFALLIGQYGLEVEEEADLDEEGDEIRNHLHFVKIRDIVEAAGAVKANYQKKMDSCLWYMQSINLPKEMKDRVREWFLYNWEQQKTIDERSLVRSLPKKLQTDLAINVHFNTLSKVQLFQDCERNLLYDLVLKLKPILYLPGDYICKKGEVGKEMYIVSQGQVEVVGGENNETVLATLHEGSVFGEISLLAMSGRGNRRTADVRSKGYTNVFTLSKHDFEMAMTEYPDAQTVLKKRAKKLLKANAKMEKKRKDVEAEEIIKTPPETPKLLQTVIQVMDPDSNVVKHLTPSLRNSYKRRPHSRSHSHRLSPSISHQQHLTPHRSLSFRQTNKHSNSSMDPSLLLDHASSIEKDGFDTDDENEEEPVYDDSSDDVSLSEVLHDAGAISSFEDDDDEDDELLIIEQYETELEQEKLLNMDGDSVPQVDRKEEKKQDSEENTREATDRRSSGNDKNETQRKDSSCGNDRGHEVTREDTSVPKEDSQDSGIPDVQRSDTCNSNGKTGQNNDGQNNNSRTVADAKNIKNGSSIENQHENTEEKNVNNDKKIKSNPGPNPKESDEKLLQHVVSMENYIEKQRWPANNETKVTVQNPSESNRVTILQSNKQKLAPPNLLLSGDSSSSEGGGNGRRRKLSVVSPPISPSSPRDKQQSHFASSNMQVVSLKENGSDLIMRNMTPVEVAPIRPTVVNETVRAKPPSDTNKTCAESANTPALTNGLEGCCGGGPLVDIPAENRVICAAEIHMQNNVNTSTTTTDIHGHTETSL